MNPSFHPTEECLKVYYFSVFSTVFFYSLIQYFQGHLYYCKNNFVLFVIVTLFFSTNHFVLLYVNRSDCVFKCLHLHWFLYCVITINRAVPVTLLCTICVFCIIFLHKIHKYFKCALQIKQTVLVLWQLSQQDYFIFYILYSILFKILNPKDLKKSFKFTR